MDKGAAQKKLAKLRIQNKLALGIKQINARGKLILIPSEIYKTVTKTKKYGCSSDQNQTGLRSHLI